jgi:hypothetical protein
MGTAGGVLGNVYFRWPAREAPCRAYSFPLKIPCRVSMIVRRKGFLTHLSGSKGPVRDLCFFGFFLNAKTVGIEQATTEYRSALFVCLFVWFFFVFFFPSPHSSTDWPLHVDT